MINEVRSINAFAEIQDLDARPVHMSDMFGLELFYASEKKILEMQEHAEEEYCEDVAIHHAHGATITSITIMTMTMSTTITTMSMNTNMTTMTMITSIIITIVIATIAVLTHSLSRLTNL